MIKAAELVIPGNQHDPIMCFFTYRYALSNHCAAEFKQGHVLYRSSEQYYMHQRAIFFGQEDAAQEIMKSGSARDAQKIGKNLPQMSWSDERERWHEVRIKHMAEALLLKFNRNSACRHALLSTQTLFLVEASPSDRFWGAGADMEQLERGHPIQGQNMLGTLLVTLRDGIREDWYKD